MHTASLPGFPPNQDTGNLARSVKLRGSLRQDNLELVADIKYGIFLEAGTEHIRPRPFFYDTILKRIKTKSFQNRMNQVTDAIYNEMTGKQGLLKKGKWTVVK